eukprot:216924-Lingulodinium_polyedra.AAC.1
MEPAPRWLSKRAGAPEEAGPPAAKARRGTIGQAMAAAGGGSKTEVVEELVRILTMLSLTCAADLRTVVGIVVMTYLIDADKETVKTAREEGASYDARAKANAKARQEGVESEDLAAPYLYIYAALIQKWAGMEKLEEQHRTVLKAYWNKR